MNDPLDLASRLRSNEEYATSEAADYLEQIAQWISDGEEVLGKETRFALFTIGVWWADRPWRKRDI
jgi:hypothetical protein